jgi:hypothetical protein
MPERRWRVALIDSGIDPACWPEPFSAVAFADDGLVVRPTAPAADSTGHGTRMARILGGGALRPELLVAQVFGGAGRATAAAVAAAIDWAVAAHADLVHLSLGVRQDRPVLAAAVQGAVAAGALLVAASPARGTLPYPAAYPGVLRATGDARCAPEEISALGSVQADFGACPSFAGGRSGGASVGAAHLTRVIVGTLHPPLTLSAARGALRARARYHGAERRTGAR